MQFDREHKYHGDNEKIKGLKVITITNIEIKIEECQQAVRCGDLLISLGYSDRVTQRAE